MGTKNVWLSLFLKISLFVFSTRQKVIQVWNDVGELTMTEFSFLGELSLYECMSGSYCARVTIAKTQTLPYKLIIQYINWI